MQQTNHRYKLGMLQKKKKIGMHACPCYAFLCHPAPANSPGALPHLASILHNKLAPVQRLRKPHTVAPVLCQEHLQWWCLEQVEGLVGASGAAGAGARVAVDEGQPVEAAVCAAHNELTAVRLADALRPAWYNESKGQSRWWFCHS
jgi:hypothetical protein